MNPFHAGASEKGLPPIKNWANNFVAMSVFEAVKRLEAAGRADDLARARACFAGLEEEVRRLEQSGVAIGSHASVHRRLTTLRRGRALVVVRARESCVHGEGGQQICGKDWSRGGRR